MRSVQFGFAVALILILLSAPSCLGPKRDPKACAKAENYYKLAISEYHNRHPAKARRYLKRAEDLCPTNERVQNLWGLIELGEGNYDEALRRFKRAVELEEKYSDAIHNIAAVYMAKEDYRTAIKYLKKVAADPLYNYPYLVERNLGWCYYKLGNKHEAIKHLKKAVFIEEYMCRAWYDLGIIAKESGNYEEAVEYFENAVRPNKRIPAKSCDGFLLAHYELATLYIKLGQLDKAKQHITKCVELTKEYPNSDLGKECRRLEAIVK